MCLAQGSQCAAVTPTRLESTASWSWGKHSTTEPLRSLWVTLENVFDYNCTTWLTWPARYVLSSGDCALSSIDPGNAIDTVNFWPEEWNKKEQLQEILSETLVSEYHSVWIQIRTYRMPVLIWVQTVCESYQQVKKVVASMKKVKFGEINQ